MNIHKWKRGSGLRRFSEKQRAQVRTDYESGLTLEAVARKHKASRSTVARAIVDAGGTIRAKGTGGVPS